ncbi:mercury resistance protein [Klebsiella pneumoniae]|nr:mercury resistance protein [Klebsiella pneumoniae]
MISLSPPTICNSAVQLAVFGAFAFMVVLLQIGSEAQSCPLSAGWEAVMIFP